MSKRIDVKTPMREAIDETKAEAEIAINTLKDVYEHPDKYTHTVKLSFDHTKWRNGKPIQVCLTFSDGKTMDAVIDNEECPEFMPVINNEFYTVTVAKIFDENVIFDYSIKNKDVVYELAEMYSLFEDTNDAQFQSDTVYACYYTDIVGEFIFDNENKPHKDIDGDCLMVCFYVPRVWKMKEADLPADKCMASLRIKETVKDFLKDDINWEERLGELYASGYCS